MAFTAEELEAMRLADEEIEQEFAESGLTLEEYRTAGERDKVHQHAELDNAAAHAAEQQRAYRAANKERVAEQKRAYYAANKERVAEQQRAYRAANKERVAEQQRAYRAANKERLAEQKRAYRAEHAEELYEKMVDWRNRNREAYNAYMREYMRDYKEGKRRKEAVS